MFNCHVKPIGQQYLTKETVPSFSAFSKFCNTRALACLLPRPGLALSTAFSVRSRSLCRTRWAIFFFRRSRNRSVFSFSVEPFKTPLTGSAQSNREMLTRLKAVSHDSNNKPTLNFLRRQQISIANCHWGYLFHGNWWHVANNFDIRSGLLRWFAEEKI